MSVGGNGYSVGESLQFHSQEVQNAASPRLGFGCQVMPLQTSLVLGSQGMHLFLLNTQADTVYAGGGLAGRQNFIRIGTGTSIK